MESKDSLTIEMDTKSNISNDSHNDHSIKASRTPLRIGNTIALMYRKGIPLIIIGPQCIFKSI